MRYSENQSERIELNEILLNINDDDINNKNDDIKFKHKNIYIDNNIINKNIFYLEYKNNIYK